MCVAATTWPCQFTDPNGDFRYDLTSVSSNKSDSRGFYQTSDLSGFNYYYFKLCDPSTTVSSNTPCATNTQLCQHPSLPSTDKSCGLGPPAISYFPNGSGVIMKTYDGYPGCYTPSRPRNTTINVKCAKTAGKGDGTLETVIEGPPCVYSVNIYFNAACSSPPPPPSPTPTFFLPSVEVDALEALYTATAGEWWTINTNWLSDSDPCSADDGWYGVVCDVGPSYVYVKALYLNKNNLSGSLPSDLGDLQYMKTLTFFKNNLTGQLPSELGNMENLETLDLHQNNLNGTIPPFIGSLSHLLSVRLSSNQLSGTIPDAFSEQSNLNELWLANNQISGTVPPSLIGVQLKRLQLNNNNLTGFLAAGLCDVGMFDVSGNDWYCPLPACCGKNGKQICGNCGADFCCWYLTNTMERQCLCVTGNQCPQLSGKSLVGSFESSNCDDCNAFCQSKMIHE